MSLLPATVWLALFVCIPLFTTCALSTFNRGPYGDPVPALSLGNYSRLVGFGAFGFNPVHLWIFIRTIGVAAGTTLLCLIISGPLVFWVATLRRAVRGIFVILITIPLWTNLLVRTYAWQIILSPQGSLSTLLQWVGVLGSDEGLYPGVVATMTALTFDYLPFLALPLYSAVERIDWRLWEAAVDLGAQPLAAFRHAVLPQVRLGAATGMALVFVPSLGQFLISDLLGGSTAILTGNTIAQQFGTSRDWPFGAAIATTQIVVTLVLLAWVRRRGDSFS